VNGGPDIPTKEILKRSHEVYVDWLFGSDGGSDTVAGGFSIPRAFCFGTPLLGYPGAGRT
jgi:hypothetical protein